MYFATLQELWAMGGHGVYVWSAYAIVALVLGVVLRSALRRQRGVLHRVRSRVHALKSPGPEH